LAIVSQMSQVVLKRGVKASMGTGPIRGIMFNKISDILWRAPGQLRFLYPFNLGSDDIPSLL